MSVPPDMPPSSDAASYTAPGKQNLLLIYILYLLSFVVGVTGLVGIVMAHLNRGKTGGWLESHYTYAIRTFWIGLLYGLISAILSVVVIGVLLGLLTAIWFIARCVTGLQKLSSDQPIGNPGTWFIDR